MPDDESEILAWRNLPKNTQIQYLGMGLHDARVESIKSNFLHRSLVLKFVMPHPRALLSLSEWPILRPSIRRRPICTGIPVRTLPLGFSFPVSWEQNDALTAELQAHWREESLSWRDFEGSITIEYEQIFDIFDAQLATGNDVLSIRISGYHNYSGYREVGARSSRR